MSIRSKVIKIGNSRGIRIPRSILEQVGLTDEVEMKVEGNQLIINAIKNPRFDWEDQFVKMSDAGDDMLLDDISSSLWDDEEWKW
jgi:antitoxin MazE